MAQYTKAEIEKMVKEIGRLEAAKKITGCENPVEHSWVYYDCGGCCSDEVWEDVATGEILKEESAGSASVNFCVSAYGWEFIRRDECPF
jgi:hypothetical protein